MRDFGSEEGPHSKAHCQGQTPADLDDQERKMARLPTRYTNLDSRAIKGSLGKKKENQI